VSVPSGSAAGDWPEDFAHENGNYRCRCISCGDSFNGHKRRAVCRVCHDKAVAWWASLTPDQATAEHEKQQQAVREWVDAHSSPNEKAQP
jgi:hypothetical protein